ncbi:MAG: glutamate ligase domain-containing protein, partial [Chthoniobacterales bacterium]
VLRAARATGRRRVLLLFQPHRYTRTQALQEAFGRALALADAAVVTDVYPASEAPIPGVSGQLLVDAAQRAGAKDVHYASSRAEAGRVAGQLLRPGELLVTLGA